MDWNPSSISLQVGSIVYGKLAVANKDMESELVCVSESGKAEGMGELEGGYLFTASLGLARRFVPLPLPPSSFSHSLGDHSNPSSVVSLLSLLLLPLCRLLANDCPVLLALGKHMAFEIVVGMNGNVWINSSSVKYTILVANAIMNSEFLNPDQTHTMVKELTRQLD